MPFSRPEGTNVRRNGLQGNNHLRTSKAYERFFEGYTEYAEKNAYGKTVTKRVYTGDYMVRELSRKRAAAQKVFYAALVPAALGMMLLSLKCLDGVSISRYSELPDAVCVITLAFYLRALVSCLLSGRKMTLYEYRRSGPPIMRCAFILAGGYLAGPVFILLFTLFSKEAMLSGKVFLAAGCHLVSAALFFLAALTEKRTVYVREKNMAGIPENVPEADRYMVKNNFDETIDVPGKD